jgi:hypothetical protein
MASGQRDEWAAFARGRAAELRGGLDLRLRAATVRRVRAGMWVALAALAAALFGSFGAAVWYSVRAHHLSGVPVKHTPVRSDGTPAYRLPEGPAGSPVVVPISEEQFRVWQENQDASRAWGRRAVAYFLFPTAALFVLLAARGRRRASPSPVPTARASGPGGLGPP